MREHPNSVDASFLLVRVVTQLHNFLLGEGAPKLSIFWPCSVFNEGKALPMGVKISDRKSEYLGTKRHVVFCRSLFFFSIAFILIRPSWDVAVISIVIMLFGE